MQSLNDEKNRFYHSYWTEQQRERGNVIAVVDSVWQKIYRPNRLIAFFIAAVLSVGRAKRL